MADQPSSEKPPGTAAQVTGGSPTASAFRWQGLAAALESAGNCRAIRNLLAVVLLGAIAVLSVVPGEYRPHSYMISDSFEHALAYALTALIVALLPPADLRPRWLCATLLLYAGALELLQMWIPGRTASIGDFIASGMGVVLGILIAILARPRFLRALGS